jgi:para-nitrobenzyl esterase
MYNKPYLAKKGVVLITINYRLGAFGFLAHPALTAESPHHSSGNYAIMDQLMALNWIKNNIRQFGGNPDNVTIFGQSAGGFSVIALMSTPLSKGLFHRAIAQSGGYVSNVMRHVSSERNGLASMESVGMGFVEKLAVKDRDNPLEELRAKPWQEIVTTWETAVQNKQTGTKVFGAWTLNHVIVDDYVLTKSPGKVFQSGRQHNVPFITGTTADEGTILSLLMNVGTLGKYSAYLERCFGPQWQKVSAAYSAESNSSGTWAVSRLLGDSFVAGARATARNMSRVQPHTYLYQFAMQPKIFIFQLANMKDWQKEYGCYHGAELPYLFHFMSSSKFKEEDMKLSEEIMGYWVRFARSGDPNGDGAIQWPAYELSQEKHLVLDIPISVGQHLNKEACDAIDELTDAH